MLGVRVTGLRRHSTIFRPFKQATGLVGISRKRGLNGRGVVHLRKASQARVSMPKQNPEPQNVNSKPYSLKLTSWV